MLDVIEAMTDEEIFGRTFKGESWSTWRVVLKALFALTMTAAEVAIFRELTGREHAPTTAAKEAWLICGRRAGKTLIMALAAVFLAIFRNYEPYLAPGERATVFVVATDKAQAKHLLRYIKGLLEAPLLADRVEKATEMGVELQGRVEIVVATCSSKTIRGRTLAAAILDEVAFWESSEESAEPDVEVLNAIRPALATIPNSLLIAASSPYARRGILWRAFERHFGRDDDPILVIRGATRQLNPTVPQSVIDEAMQSDPSAASAEWMAEFRSDVETFLSQEALSQCVDKGVLERPPIDGVNYVAFVDPSGGVSDAMVLAIAHLQRDGTATLDCTVTRKPPFSPEQVVADFALFLRRYRVGSVTGDHFAGEWAREPFRRHGIEYRVSAKPKREIYMSALPLISSAKADLLDNPTIVSQFLGLERRQGRGGRDTIDHRAGGHDDVANAVAGALTLAAARGSRSAAIFCPAVSVTSADIGAAAIGEGRHAPSVGIVLQTELPTSPGPWRAT